MKGFSSKGTLIAMSFILTATLMSACGKDNNGDTGANKGNGGTSTEAPAENGYKDKYDPPVTITTVWGIDSELKFKNGESIENNVAAV